MEVFQTENFYIFVKREKSLWWNRTTSEFTLKAGWDLSSVDDIECIGIAHGIVGVISLPNVYEPHLVIIKEAVPVGALYPPHLVYKIKSICILSSDDPDSVLTSCTKHLRSSNTTPTHSANSNSSIGSKPKLFEGNQLMNKTWGAVKIAGNTIKNTTQQAAAIASNQVRSSVGIKDPSRIEKRITEELHKVFDDTDSFYFCFDTDITNNLQRHSVDQSYDERFFWNKHMIRDILALNDKTWILPIIQGFVQVEPCVIGNECFTLALVSRRSRHRAGTRYKRRGVDENGNCANYVETEQILTFRHHQLSFTQVRGSIPIYWSQPGYKYRPPPRLDKGEIETQEAFEKHFNKELALYENICIVNLVEQTGKEKVIGDAYANYITKLDDDRIVYVTFDFHDYCRGMRFENVSTLVEALAPEAGAMGFHWRDQRGVICNQKSVFRVNCMDCLDRTNVVQTAIGKAVLESQLVKLGLSPPYTPIPEPLKTPFMILWANNGDIISRQYAGTNALKGDYTRTGERKISGMMKDGMNSANRYYLARFKDTYRQATIDLMLGNQVTPESVNALGGEPVKDETDAVEIAEHARLLIEDCRRLLLGSAQYPVGAWGLIDADPTSGDVTETEVDSILLLTDDCYIVAEYDSHLDKIVRFEKVLLQNIIIIELGMYQQQKLFQNSSPVMLCLRLNYTVEGQDGYFHMFRSANIRFFNNMTYIIKSQEEVMESLMSIVEMFRIALDNIGNNTVRFITDGMLQRRKSKNRLLEVPKGMPRNLSESQLVQFSTKAISNVAGQFSKLGQTFNPNKSKSINQKPSEPGASKPNSTAKTNPLVMQQTQNAVDKSFEAGKVTFSVGGAPRNSSTSSTDTEEHDNSIYEPDIDSDVELGVAALCSEKNNYNENSFLPSVGIVMGQNNSTSQDQQQQNQDHLRISPAEPVQRLVFKDSMHKQTEDVLTISISSVTDHVTMPSAFLENTIPVRPITPNPQIYIDTETVPSSNRSVLQNDLIQQNMYSDSSKFKQISSPFSKLAKGMQNIGLNLDPRKIASKTGVLSPSTSSAENSPAESSSDYRKQLVEMWAEKSCKSKLIAL